MINFISQWILSLLILVPLVAAVVIVLLPSKNTNTHKHVALFATVVELVLSLHLVKYFDAASAGYQFLQTLPWLPAAFGIKYVVGVDGISLILVILTTLFSSIVAVGFYTAVKTRVKAFLTLFLLLEAAIVGVAVSLDVVLFYIFWELSLIPVYFMVGIWGGTERFYATLKFFIYGVVGSLLMLVALIYLYCAHADLNNGVYSTQIFDLYKTAAALPINVQTWLFLAITLAFAIKVPVFPFYSWMPDVYTQAPAVYTLMSGLTLKLAVYGLIRFSIGLFPAVAVTFSTPIVILGVIGIIYGALIAWQQTNMRRIMAFSSISHLGFMVVGVFSLNTIGLQGALYQMINHTVTAGALFILLNFIYEKYGSLDIEHFGGLTKVYPWYAFFFVIAAMSAVSLPGTGSFVGEWLVLLGLFQTKPILAICALSGVVLGAVYVLWFTYKIIFGPLKITIPTAGLRKAEVVQLVLLSIAIFALGFVSTAILDHTKPSLIQLERSVNQ